MMNHTGFVSMQKYRVRIDRVHKYSLYLCSNYVHTIISKGEEEYASQPTKSCHW